MGALLLSHKDAAGNTLAVGDVVASTDGGHAGVVLFEVVGLTDQKVKILRLDGQASIGKSGHGNRAAGKPKTMFPEQVIKAVTPVHPAPTEVSDNLEVDLRNLVTTWRRDAAEHLMMVGQHMHASLEILADQAEAILPNQA